MKNSAALRFKIIPLSFPNFLTLSFKSATSAAFFVEYLKKFGKAKRSTIDNLLISKLSAILSDDQKKSKVGNLLTALRKEGRIKIDNDRLWILV